MLDWEKWQERYKKNAILFEKWYKLDPSLIEGYEYINIWDDSAGFVFGTLGKLEDILKLISIPEFVCICDSNGFVAIQYSIPEEHMEEYKEYIKEGKKE